VLSATASSDFSNAFGTRSNERFLPTWALSARWNLHSDVLKEVTWIDLAALRLSYGKQGNMIPEQTPYTIIKKGSMNSYYGTFGSNIIAFPNPFLAWEEVHDYGAGFDFSFLGGKIGGSFAWYFKRTVNAFLTKELSAVNGVSSYLVNGGTVENQGVEMQLQFKPINNAGLNKQKRGFMWRLDPQLGQVFNKLLNKGLQSGKKNILVDPNSITYDGYLTGSVPVNGKSINTFYSYRFLGLDHEYGFPVFYGAEPENAAKLALLYNTMSKEEVFNSVMIESGRREPVLQGGIGNTFAWRNWMLSFTFTYSFGNKIRLLQIASGNYGTFQPSSQQNLRKEFVNRWRYPGDEQKTNIPALAGYDNFDPSKYSWWNGAYGIYNITFARDYYQMYDFSDLRVVSGDYVKLQYVSLAYDLNQDWCKKWRIKGATINISGSNLFTIANKALRGQDPSQSGSSPNINLTVRPVYALNFNLTF
jgi:hypothetical protein